MAFLDHTINTSKKTRWTRISQLTPIEELELHEITQKTAGMSLYGNRARTSVMLPLELARIIAKEAKERNSTVNQVIVEMLASLHGDDNNGADRSEH